MYKLFNFFFIFLLLISSNATAASKNLNKTNKGPVKITSKEMTSYENGLKIIFKEKVVTRKDNTTIFSDILEVYNNEKKDKIIKIIAKNNVRVEKEGKYAEGDLATFFQDKNFIELTGNVKAWEGDNLITGDRAEFHLNNDIVKVTGNVNVIFYPKEDENKKTEDRKQEPEVK